MNERTKLIDSANKHTRSRILISLALTTIIFGASVLSAGCELQGSFQCMLADRVEAGELIYTRAIFVIFDQTGSMSGIGKLRTQNARGKGQAGAQGNTDFKRVVKDIVKNEVISGLAPGDYVECFQIGGEPDRYDAESYRVFGGRDSSMKIRKNIATGGITDKDLNSSCPKRSWPKGELKDQWKSFEQYKARWLEKLETAPAPANTCCSAYLAALKDIAERLQSETLPAERWLIIIGDFLEEPGLASLKQSTNLTDIKILPPKAGEGDRDVFAEVNVLLIRPSGTLSNAAISKVDEYWRHYFAERGNDRIKQVLAGLPPVLGQTRIARPN